jgi:uridine kinase
LVRDSQFRGSTTEEVFKTWLHVHAGEEKYIFPYQEDADIFFNSSLIYELSILRQYTEPLLRAITPENETYLEAYRLYAFLNNFIPLQSSFVPSNSILREFIGT